LIALQIGNASCCVQAGLNPPAGGVGFGGLGGGDVAQAVEGDLEMAAIGGADRPSEWTCGNAGVGHHRCDQGNVLPAARELEKLFSVGLNAGEDRHDLAGGIALAGAMHSVEVVREANGREDADDGHSNRQFRQGEAGIGTSGCAWSHVNGAEQQGYRAESAALRSGAFIQHRLHVDLAGVEIHAALHGLAGEAFIGCVAGGCDRVNRLAPRACVVEERGPIGGGAIELVHVFGGGFRRGAVFHELGLGLLQRGGDALLGLSGFGLIGLPEEVRQGDGTEDANDHDHHHQLHQGEAGVAVAAALASEPLALQLDQAVGAKAHETLI